MQLIDKDALEKVVEKMKLHHGIGLEPVIAVSDLQILIKGLPTVDAVPVKHGQWEEQTIGSYEENAVIAEWQSARCSECGRYLTTPYLYYFTKYNFCPECGAKMDGERRKSE